jgi:hypothetical protein
MNRFVILMMIISLFACSEAKKVSPAIDPLDMDTSVSPGLILTRMPMVAGKNGTRCLTTKAVMALSTS